MALALHPKVHGPSPPFGIARGGPLLSTTTTHGLESPRSDDSPALVLAYGRRISRTTLFWLLHCGGWLAFGIAPFAWTADSWGLWGDLLCNAIFIVSGGLLTLGLRQLYRRLRSANVSYAILAPMVLVLCSIVAEVWYLASLLLDRATFDRLIAVESLRAHFAVGATRFAQAPLLMGMSHWFLHVFVLLTWSSLYFGIHSILALELEKTRVADALKLADAARLKVLQSQLNPHFLFNSLNGVATLIREHRGAAALTMISTLGEFLRTTIRTVNIPEITVAEELVFVDQFVELQQLRFADRLKVDVDVEEATYSALLPTLILQPLVENAVQHGVLTRERGGSVRIAIRRAESELWLTVHDDGPGAPESSPPKFGVGLSNTAARLRALYGDKGSLSFGRSAFGGFSILVRLPFRESTGARTS